jgi:hypothetical protein
MPLPETIPVRYTDEEAGYVTVRPVVKQTFSLEELLDMILSVAGKDVARIRQLLHSGTIVYHFFRYNWTGFDVDDSELAAELAKFPDPEPNRPFSAAQCTLAILESGGVTPRHLMEIEREAGSKRRFLRKESFWDALLQIATSENLQYHAYSYGRAADIYRLDLDGEITEQITAALKRLAPRGLHIVLGTLPAAASILFVCPRAAIEGSARP